MSTPWTFNGEPTSNSAAGTSTTLVEGSSFAICSASGDIEPGGTEGLFFEDTRYVSMWRFRLNGEELQSLALIPRHPFAATFVLRGQPHAGEADSTMLVERSRYVGNGMREDLTIHNLGREASSCEISFELQADFAHLFDVKESRTRAHGHETCEIDASVMRFSHEYRGMSRRLDVVFPPEAKVAPGVALVHVVIPSGAAWTTSLEFRLTVDGEPVELRYGKNVEQSPPVARLKEWHETTPLVRSDDKAMEATFAQSERDLGALRIPDPEHEDRSVIAAGAPWFMTLFGRDSLITSLMTLDVDPNLATSALRTLARMQGTRVDAVTEEQPGKILHEMRRGLTKAADTHAGSIYYGSIDATPLFVVLLGELFRWGISTETVLELLPHADRALSWVEQYGDRDGDGFVEYQRATSHGLLNQGWKDSFDSVGFAHGDLAEAPIALAEVQGYVYAAYIARAEIARSLGDRATADSCAGRAAQLKADFNERFWSAAGGYFAMGLDGEKRQIDALTSNIGHCLWSGIIEDNKVAATVERLCGPEMFSGWGIRTLATTMDRYNPVSYHNGSVWPHDSAISAAGLARYGYFEEAEAVTVGLFDAAASFGGRLPELFCGFDRDTYSIPVPYPTSCSPQAWASASPFWLLRTTLLGLEPDIPHGVITCAPHIPERVGHLTVENLTLGGSQLSIDAVGSRATIRGLPDSLRLAEEAQDRTSAVVSRSS